MNRKTLTKQCQKLYQNILMAIQSDDKLRNFSDEFSIILERFDFFFFERFFKSYEFENDKHRQHTLRI